MGLNAQIQYDRSDFVIMDGTPILRLREIEGEWITS